MENGLYEDFFGKPPETSHLYNSVVLKGKAPAETAHLNESADKRTPKTDSDGKIIYDTDNDERRQQTKACDSKEHKQENKTPKGPGILRLLLAKCNKR